MNNSSDSEILRRIQEALEAAVCSISHFVLAGVKTEFKSEDDPVTEVDRTANRVLRDSLVRDGEGWLSEESADDLSRLGKERVWIVDPLDGTREFLAGVPEWCISVGLVENGRLVAGGICNPATGEVFLGALGQGIRRNGNPVRSSERKSLAGAVVLASRSEMKRGEWEHFRQAPFAVRPTGSVAYKLALVAAGLADATWTLSPKNEWDIAAGVALVEAGGGVAQGKSGLPPKFNEECTLLPGLLACGPHLCDEITALLQG